jgi:hypothetical protein
MDENDSIAPHWNSANDQQFPHQNKLQKGRVGSLQLPACRLNRRDRD